MSLLPAGSGQLRMRFTITSLTGGPRSLAPWARCPYVPLVSDSISSVCSSDSARFMRASDISSSAAASSVMQA